MRIGIVRTAASPCRCAQAVMLGLKSLGHDFLLFDSEDIEMRAAELASACDLVIDHTDTFRGRGTLRPLVRLLLERAGALVVGSDAQACFVADDKSAAKACLTAAGITTPPGIAYDSKAEDLPAWLTPPLIVKPAFEHMSRGLGLAQSADQARAMAAELRDQLQQPILVETYIPGRELAVSVLEGAAGLEVLPPLEWRLAKHQGGLLTKACKLQDVNGARDDAGRADLAPPLLDDLAGLACRAFQALHLRDYARFDVRLSPGGTFFFLEANTTPSLEPAEALALSARWAGLEYAGLVERMLAAALRRASGLHRSDAQTVCVALAPGPVELHVRGGVHCPPPSSLELARMLDVRAGDRVLDLGCGSGLLCLAAARLGARRVVAVDIDPQALDATACNARANNEEARIDVRAGSWYDALDRSAADQGSMRFEVIVAAPPQTPAPHPFGPRYGGWDGTRHLLAVIEGAPRFLDPSNGRLWLLAISLANPAALFAKLRELFYEVVLVRETERLFTADEYEAMEKGLMGHMLALRETGQAEFQETGRGAYVFRNLFVRAAGVRQR